MKQTLNWMLHPALDGSNNVVYMLNACSHSAVEIIIVFAAAINGFSSSGHVITIHYIHVIFMKPMNLSFLT
jgi:hypothetical protein